MVYEYPVRYIDLLQKLLDENTSDHYQIKTTDSEEVFAELDTYNLIVIRNDFLPSTNPVIIIKVLIELDPEVTNWWNTDKEPLTLFYGDLKSDDTFKTFLILSHYYEINHPA